MSKRDPKKTKPAPRAKAAPQSKPKLAAKAIASAKPAAKAKSAPVAKPVKIVLPPAAKISSKAPIRPITKAAMKSADKKLTAKSSAAPIVLPPDYHPDESEPFMSARHRLYFRQKLVNWKEEIIRQTKETLAGLHEDSTQHADLADRATSETDRALELRARDRQRKLISKIDAALSRIEDGTYGYCEETGEPIGLKRLDARPIATLSVEAQERHERRERVYRED